MPVVREKKSLCDVNNFEYVTGLTQNGKKKL